MIKKYNLYLKIQNNKILLKNSNNIQMIIIKIYKKII